TAHSKLCSFPTRRSSDLEGAYKRNFSCSCKTCSDAYHVALCNTAVNVAFRKLFLKHSSLGSCSKVSIQNNDIFMFFSKFYQSCRSEEHTSELQSRFDLVC